MSIQTIDCVANRGTQYKVTFVDGQPRKVLVIYYVYGTTIQRTRKLWHAGEYASMTVSCAVRAARRKLMEKRDVHCP